MSQLLQAIYDQFYSFQGDVEMIREIDSSHRALSAELSKEQRRTLLKIIDIKDSLAEIQSIDSFIRGFQLAAQLAAELRHYSTESLTREGEHSELVLSVKLPYPELKN